MVRDYLCAAKRQIKHKSKSSKRFHGNLVLENYVGFGVRYLELAALYHEFA
jgi:hypothetical protein